MKRYGFGPIKPEHYEMVDGKFMLYEDHLAEIAKWKKAVEVQELRIKAIKAAMNDYGSPLG